MTASGSCPNKPGPAIPHVTGTRIALAVWGIDFDPARVRGRSTPIVTWIIRDAAHHRARHGLTAAGSRRYLTLSAYSNTLVQT